MINEVVDPTMQRVSPLVAKVTFALSIDRTAAVFKIQGRGVDGWREGEGDGMRICEKLLTK